MRELARTALGMSPSSNIAAPFPFSSFIAASPCPALIPAEGARFSRSAPACLRRDGTQHSRTPSRTSGAAAGRRRCDHRRISSGWCCTAHRRLLVLARGRAARDEDRASDNDPGVHHHLRSTVQIVVKRSIGIFTIDITFLVWCVSLRVS